MPDRKQSVTKLADVKPKPRSETKPTKVQIAYLRRGLGQPGGKLPLFDMQGQRVSDRTVQRCIEQGWAEPWFNNPIKPDWLVCKLTSSGRDLVRQ